MKNRPVGAELFHAKGHTERRTDGRKDRCNETNSRFFAILRMRLKIITI